MWPVGMPVTTSGLAARGPPNSSPRGALAGPTNPSALALPQVPINRRSLAGSTVASNELQAVEDAYADLRFDPYWDRKSGYRTVSILCCPVRRGVTVVTVATVVTVVPHGLDPLLPGAPR